MKKSRQPKSRLAQHKIEFEKMPQLPEQIDVNADRSTVWVHALDGSTVGQFSKIFGMDIYRTVTEQMAGASQCLHCTHVKPTLNDWLMFCDLMLTHHGIEVSKSLISMENAFCA